MKLNIIVSLLWTPDTQTDKVKYYCLPTLNPLHREMKLILLSPYFEPLLSIVRPWRVYNHVYKIQNHGWGITAEIVRFGNSILTKKYKSAVQNFNTQLCVTSNCLSLYVGYWYIPLSRSAWSSWTMVCYVVLDMVLSDNLSVYRHKLPE